MIVLNKEKEQRTVHEPERLLQVVENVGYLAYDQAYLEQSVLEKLAKENGCERLRAVVAARDNCDVIKRYDYLKLNGFVPIEVILGGIYVLEKKII